MDKIGQFTVLRPLATGGMAHLFLVKRNGSPTDQLFVIKKVLEGVNDQKHFSKLFAQEAKLSISFNHPNLVRTIEVGSHNNNLYLVQEYIEGHNLKDILQSVQRKDGIFPSSVAYHILNKVSLGLAYLHGELDENTRVCTHRDLSPHNIMISRWGDVKIIDFGISNTEGQEPVSASDAVQGKYAYMSPEQARGEKASPASDIFSLGVIFYELISGLRFYGKYAEVNIIRALDEWSEKDVQLRLLDIPHPGHREILKRSLDPDPNKRPKASELNTFFEEELASYEEELTKDTLIQNLEYCLSEYRNKEVYGGLSEVLQDGVPDLQNITTSDFPAFITLYDVLTEEKRRSYLWGPALALSLLGLLYVGKIISNNPEKIWGFGRAPASVSAPPSPKIVLSESLLVRLPPLGEKVKVRVFVNDRELSAQEISEGFKVFDGDVLDIKTQTRPRKKWKEHRLVIDTQAPPQFNFDL